MQNFRREFFCALREVVSGKSIRIDTVSESMKRELGPSGSGEWNDELFAVHNCGDAVRARGDCSSRIRTGLEYA